jgi:hypothetical protein
MSLGRDMAKRSTGWHREFVDPRCPASKQLAKTAISATLSEQIGARLDRAQARLGPMGPRGRCRGLISSSPT